MVAPDIGAAGPGAGGRLAARLAALLLPLIVLLALLALAFADVLFAGHTLSPASYVPGVLPSGPVGAPPPPLPPPLRDLEGAAWVDEPAPYLVHGPLAAGRLPLWNAGVGLGAPLAANPNMAAWSPLQLVPNLWPTPLVQDLAWLLRVLVLGLSTWALARALGCLRLAALVASSAIMLSGQSVEWIVHHPLNTDAFVPLALAAAVAVLRRCRAGAVVLALAIAAALLGVKPQSAVTATIFGALVLCAVAYDERLPRAGQRARGVVTLLAAALLGVALAAVALLPFVESYASASGLVRAGRTTQSEWTLPLATLPGLAGGWVASLLAGSAPPGGLDPARLGPPYAGSTVLALAAVGTWRARRRAVTRVLAATVLVYLARIFGLLPIPLAGVPVLGSINYVKYCFPLYLALALLAAFALGPGGRSDPPAGRRTGARRVAAASALLVLLELLWLAPRDRPMRVDPYAPAPWVDALRALSGEVGGRITGPVTLAPPLVSNVLGFDDLRAIDVLTPRAGYEFVSHLVAPSEGVTWILADPDPLVAATSPGSPVANLRWILSRGALAADELPRVTRSLVSGRRLLRLFSALDAYEIETASLGGGIHEIDGDRRFHWSCVTPCRFRFALADRPSEFVAGLAAAEEVDVRVALREHGVDDARAATARLRLGPGDGGWRDVWLAGGAVTGRGRGPVEISLDLDAGAPRTVFVGGVGPSPGREREAADVRLETAYRRAALADLRLRYADATAHVYEDTRALGDAYLATDVVTAADVEEVRACLLAHRSRAVACVANPDLAARLGRHRAGGEERFLRHGAGGEERVLRHGAGGEVRILERRADALVVETRAEHDSLLVVPRLFASGWSARIDDVAAAIERANAAMMAVVVPPGTHLVALRYQPPTLWVGAGISLLAALLAGLAGAWSLRATWFEGASGRG